MTSVGHAAVPARVELTLETNNWYPVPEQQMQSVTGTAMARSYQVVHEETGMTVTLHCTEGEVSIQL